MTDQQVVEVDQFSAHLTQLTGISGKTRKKYVKIHKKVVDIIRTFVYNSNQEMGVTHRCNRHHNPNAWKIYLQAISGLVAERLSGQPGPGSGILLRAIITDLKNSS
ncbi:MAG: hypothetical protein IJ179_01740 [Oscillospiraceae bacterium]|nr:hypothetical protein [Oscillospiraceae bacterium]